MAGNETHSFELLKAMSFFYHLQEAEVKSLLGIQGDQFNYTLAALKFAGKANGVSKLHGIVTQKMWGDNAGICEIISITNAQNEAYWKDPVLDAFITCNDNEGIIARKKEMKRSLFKVVADQCSKLFDDNILTVVWARRFAGYKRADLIMKDWERFTRLLEQTDRPIQLIWAGKPYPEDESSIEQFNPIVLRTQPFARCAVLTGYELALSAMLKKGSDLWLNNPRLYHEASGTSGMTAAMNGSINLSIPDGWVPEFARDLDNCFLIKPAQDMITDAEKDMLENRNLMDTLENIVLPMYYDKAAEWTAMLKKAAADIVPAFESARLADEYYAKLYNNSL
jgi:starch phosphorylase